MNSSPHDLRISGQGPIAMVDDSETDFYIANLMFKRSALTNPFVHFSSGNALLDYLDQPIDEAADPLSLVLMDLNMPGMNGIETVVEIRKRPRYREVPIIAILTSSADPKDRDRASKAGANQYFNKPMDPSDYVAMFNALAEGNSDADRSVGVS